MKRMAWLVVVMLLIECGKTEFMPAGSSEATAADVTKNSAGSAGITTATPVLRLSPAQTIVKTGNEIVVEVAVDNASNLFGVGFGLYYPPCLQFVRAEEGDFLKYGATSVNLPNDHINYAGASTLFMAVDNHNGYLTVGQTRLGSRNGGVSGSGVIGKFIFKAIAPTVEGTLFFSEVSLRDPELTALLSETQSAKIKIE